MKLNYFILIALLLYFKNYSQKSNFMVTTSSDTIYVDNITVTDFKIITKTAHKKKTYAVDNIISYYLSEEDKYYVRIMNQIEKKERTDADRYDYKRMENLYIEEYNNRVKYKFIQRLTHGKVKLFSEAVTVVSGGLGMAGSATYFSANQSAENIYYISIYDSKVELINYEPDFIIFENRKKLKLCKGLYEILVLYLLGNNEITKRLDALYLSKPKATEEQILNLIHDYNNWAASNK